MNLKKILLKMVSVTAALCAVLLVDNSVSRADNPIVQTYFTGAYVSKKGQVTGKNKGTCYIYVYTENGIYKKVKVRVS